MGGRGIFDGFGGGLLGGACGGGCGGWGDGGCGSRRGCDNDRGGCFVTAVRAGCFRGDGDFGREGGWF